MTKLIISLILDHIDSERVVQREGADHDACEDQTAHLERKATPLTAVLADQHKKQLRPDLLANRERIATRRLNSQAAELLEACTVSQSISALEMPLET